MENRGQKRTEVVDELPADKRACNSLDFRPSSSNSSVQTEGKSSDSTVQSHEADMETSSTASASIRSEGEGEREYLSCDSDDAELRYSGLREYHRNQYQGDHFKLKTILSCLSEETEADGQLAALTELCEVLSFFTEESFSSTYSNTLAPILVKLTKHESNPEIVLLALRAITYLCDLLPSSSGFLFRYGVIPALCGRLMEVEYSDVAEQCLQALEKISREQPLACLHSGAIMAVLSYIDFFSTSVQRVALSTVVNICQNLPPKCPILFIMDAVPLLCNLLQCEDRQLVESVAICLIKIVDQVWKSPEMLNELYKHGLINQVINRIKLNRHTMLSQPVYFELFGVLMKLAAGSTSAFKTLHELNIFNLLKDVLSANEISLAMSSPHLASGHYAQVQDVLLLLKELLPYSANRGDIEQVSEKEAFLANNPECLWNFGTNILPLLIQMVNSGANVAVAYSCLSVIRNLFSLSTSNVLVQVLSNCNTSSFLAGVFIRKDKHVLMMALQIAETCLKKLPDVFLNSFMKEGVFFAIDSLLQPEETSSKLFQSFSGSSQFFLAFSPRVPTRAKLRCLCFAFDTAQPTSSSEAPPCSLEKDAVLNLAKHIRTSFFPPEICSSGGALTDVLQMLRSFSTDLMNVSKNEDSMLTEDKIYPLLSQIVEKITSKEPISTFELIESGILNSLVNYLSFCEKTGVDGQFCSMDVVEKRFERLVNLLLPLSDNHSEDIPLLVLVRKLQNALSSLETFPIVLTHGSKIRNYYATVPYKRAIPYPSFRVRFVKEEGEACLSDYSQDVLVDPFTSLDAVERFLFSKVMQKGSESIEDDTSEEQPEEDENQDFDYKDMQEGDASLSQAQPEQADGHLSETQPGVGVAEKQSNSTEPSSVEVAGVSQVMAAEVDIKMTDCPVSSDNFDSISKLILYLNGQQLDETLTLYQAILEQQMKREGGMVAGSKFWTQVYTLTYGMAVKHQNCNGFVDLAENPSPSKRSEGIPQLSCLSIASDLEEYSSVFDILILLKSMNLLNKLAYQLASRQSMSSFAEERIDNLNYLKAVFPSLTENEFVNKKLTEKLEQQLRDPLVVSTGAMPLWCAKLLSSCPFLFSFECRSKFFRLAAFGQSQAAHSLGNGSSTTVGSSERRRIVGSPSRKFIVHRDRIMDSAEQLMQSPASKGGAPLEVQFNDEVGTGLGPTLEFFTSISHEFQKLGLYMWRGDHQHFASTAGGRSKALDSDLVSCHLGLFPRPISPDLFADDNKQSAEVISRFFLLGKLVAKALQDRRFLDFHFSKSFYKLIIGQELCLFDILSFDPELGRTMLEFQALVNRRKSTESVQNCVLCFKNMSIEDLCLDFTLPGYPDYVLSSNPDHTLVNITNLEQYVSLVLDATIRTGISRQVEAFKSGFNQVFPIQNLEIFSEEEVERLLCGEQESWTLSELLDHIKFDHGYTASSPPVLYLLEIMLEFDEEQRRAFVQFVTGAPRLPPGGLASLHPKFTIVRKHCSNAADAELPSVMTCANYLKLPPYSSKEKVRERMLYAIKEGQGSFHLS